MWIKNHKEIVKKRLDDYKCYHNREDKTTSKEFTDLIKIIGNGYNKVISECKKLSIPVGDLHEDNIGWKDGVIVGFDFGLVRTKRKHKSLKKIFI